MAFHSDAPRWVLVALWTTAIVLALVGVTLMLVTGRPLALLLALGLAVPLLVLPRRRARG